jgi:hypothetical protein
MADDDEHPAFTPFRPASGPVDARIAAALEYIAAQIGEINAKMGHGDGEYETEDEDEKDDEKEEAAPRRR